MSVVKLDMFVVSEILQRPCTMSHTVRYLGVSLLLPFSCPLVKYGTLVRYYTPSYTIPSVEKENGPNSNSNWQLTWHPETKECAPALTHEESHGASSVPALADPPRAASPCPFVSSCQPTTRGPPVLLFVFKVDNRVRWWTRSTRW